MNKVYRTVKFLSGLKYSKRDVKRWNTMRTLYDPASEKRTQTLKKLVSWCSSTADCQSALLYWVSNRLSSTSKKTKNRFVDEFHGPLTKDNAPSHSILSVKAFLAKHSLNNWLIKTKSPCLINHHTRPMYLLVTTIFFPKVKSELKGTRFGIMESVKIKRLLTS